MGELSTDDLRDLSRIKIGGNMLKIKIPVLAIVFLLSNNCGPNLGKVEEDEGTPEGQFDPNNPQITEVGVSVSEDKSGNSFRLASATAFTISLEDCASGYSSTANENSPDLQVYKFDQDCLAKLTTFEYGGVTYVPTVGDPFATWLAGDIATFEDDSDPTSIIRVQVVSQLDSPISGTEPVEYLFSLIDKGTDESIPDTEVGDGHAIAVDGQDPPSFTIASVSFVGMTANGAGQFVFTLECTSGVTGSGATRACEGLLLDDIRYKLVQDTYSSNMTINDAVALFPTGESSIANAAEHLDTGAGGTTNGGFVSKTLTGPDAMDDNPNMILILEAADTSYQYFNVDVTTLNQL
jgi:hypothetical protein